MCARCKHFHGTKYGETDLPLSLADSSPSPMSPPCSLLLFSAFSVLNSEKRNTEDTKNHSAAEPQPKVEGASILDKMRRFSENTASGEEQSAMKEFIAKHRNEIAGVLSGFDRLIFRGTLRSLAHVAGMQTYLAMNKILLKDFARHVQHISQRLKEASLARARALGRPVQYLVSGRVKKEEVARRMAAEQGVGRGVDRCAELRGTVPEFRGLPQCAESAVGVGAALAKMLVSVPLLDASALGFHARSDSNLVSIPHPDRLERAGVVGAADAGRRPGVCAAGQLFSLGARLEPGATTAGSATASELAEPAGGSGSATEPDTGSSVRYLSGPLLLDDLPERMGQRCGVSASGDAAALVSTAGASWADRFGQHGCAAFPGTAHSRQRRGAQALPGRSAERVEAARGRRAHQTHREWQLGETVRQSLHGGGQRVAGRSHFAEHSRPARLSSSGRGSARGVGLAADATRDCRSASPSADFAASHRALLGCLGRSR